jgi:8-oxo-dGTP pyrophosphatase MutT (NUDIX family)
MYTPANKNKNYGHISMRQYLKTSWAGVRRTVSEQPRSLQVAALCYRESTDGKQILLITSRDTKRWILPKGWPIEGLDGPASALQEAWEEAGVCNATITPEPLGTYSYDKRLSGGAILPVEATVYLTLVGTLAQSFPEVEERTRTWVSPAEAAKMVDEPELKAILLEL